MTSQSEQASASGAAVPVGAAQAEQQPAPSKGRSVPTASARIPAHSSARAALSSETGESSKASAGSAAERVGTSGVQQGEGGHRGGQQQVARLTASNTALLAELVDLQVHRHLAPLRALLSHAHQCGSSHMSIRRGGAMLSKLLSANSRPAKVMCYRQFNAFKAIFCNQWAVGHILLIAGCAAHAWHFSLAAAAAIILQWKLQCLSCTQHAQRSL